MKISDIKNLFKKTDDNGFPVNDCINKNKEENIYDGERYYLCLVIDARFPGYFEIMRLKPYIWKDKETKSISFGWTDEHGNIVDNLYKSIHIDDRCVIGCIIDESDDDFLKKEWEEYKNILENQWE